MKTRFVKIVSLVLALMTLCSASLALADGSLVVGNTKGENIKDSDGQYGGTILYGTDATKNDPYIIVFVKYKNGDFTGYYVFTKKTNVLDALTDAGLVKAEKVSWGYSITTVDTIRADYNKDGAWWAYYTVNLDEGSKDQIGVGLETLPITTGDMYWFQYSK